jgi:hypothetical protein
VRERIRHIFRAESRKPERSPTPEGKDLSPLAKQFDHISALANNGHIDQITPENFPDIPKDEVVEIRYVGYMTRIMRYINIAASTKDQLIKESCKAEVDRLTKLRDEDFKKNHSKIIESAPRSDPSPIKREEKPIISPQKKYTDDALYL